MNFLYSTKYEILRKYTRVVDTAVVVFYLVKKTNKFLGGLFSYTTKTMKISYDMKSVPEELRYKVAMGIKAAGYNILYNESELMTAIED